MTTISDTFDISVIVTVYNGERFIRAAVQSLLAEPVENLEILVVNDGSTDGSLAAIADLGVRVISLPENRGMSTALNVGMRHIRGRYVTLLDCDDILFPGSLKWRRDWLHQNPHERAVAGRPAGVIDAEGNDMPQFPHVLHESFRPPKRLTSQYFLDGGVYPVSLWNYMFRRELLEEVGEFDESLKRAADFEYLFRLLERTTIPVVFRPVVYRRLHDSNVSVSLVDGEYRLNPQNIEVCTKVLTNQGLEKLPESWALWENGYCATSRTPADSSASER